LQPISGAFEKVKGVHCGVCIKLLSGVDQNNIKVLTLCRDEKSSSKRVVGSRDIVPHWITENTDFYDIFGDPSSGDCDTYFFAHNLPLRFDYENTNLKKHNWPPTRIPILEYFVRWWTWPLKYKSTIVVPIIPYSLNDRSKDKLRGFLCIDSQRSYTFNKQSDVEILKGVADGIYNNIDKLYIHYSNDGKRQP
jgi:hypothetical protein